MIISHTKVVKAIKIDILYKSSSSTTEMVFLKRATQDILSSSESNHYILEYYTLDDSIENDIKTNIYIHTHRK